MVRSADNKRYRYASMTIELSPVATYANEIFVALIGYGADPENAAPRSFQAAERWFAELQQWESQKDQSAEFVQLKSCGNELPR